MRKALILLLALALCLAAVPALAETVAKVSGGNANLRSGPGLDYADLDTIKNGQTATYLNSSAVDDRGVTWYKVKFNGTTGWVSSKYAKLIDDSTGGAAFDFFSGGGDGASEDTVKIAGGDANLRGGPGLDFSQLDVIPEGKTATYLEKSAVDERGVTWYKVKYNGVTGWVSSKYAKLTGSASDDTVKIAGGDANLRSGPGLKYDQLDVILEGRTAAYLGKSSVDDRGVTWYKVKYNGVTGWVSSKYAKLTGGSASEGTVRIYGGDANLRSGPGLKYSQLDVIPEGRTAAYLGKSSVDDRGVTWYKVKYSGTTGWVSSKFAKLY